MTKSNKVASLLLSPSANFFDKYDYEISIERQRSNIVNKIREREALLREFNLKQIHFEWNPLPGMENEIESTCKLKEITFNIVDLIVDLEVIRERNELPQSKSGRLFDRSLPRPKLVESFDWFGKSYLLKILEDSRGLFDIDNINVLDTDSVSNKNRHSKIIERLVFEKEIGGNTIKIQQMNIQVATTIAGNQHGFDEVVFDVKETPFFDPGRLVLEDVGAKVIVACLTVLFSKREFSNDKEILDKKTIAKLSKVDLHVLARNIEKTSRSTKIIASKNNLIVIYNTLQTYVHQIQPSSSDLDENMMRLQDWLLATIVNNYRYLPPLKDNCHDIIASRENIQNTPHTSGDNDEYKEDYESESMDESDEESECRGSDARSTFCIAGKVSMPDPCYVKASEGNKCLVVVKGKSQLQEGDQIRVGHPYFSRVYVVEAMDKKESSLQQIYLNTAFDYSSILRKEIADPSEVIEYLHDPKQRFAMKEKERKPLLESTSLSESSTQIYESLDSETMHDRQPLEFDSIRIWKLVPKEIDKRLEWRRHYDNGLVPWQNVSSEHILTTRFKVKVVLSDIIEDCKDNVARTNAFPHQQRLNFFEKVQLNLIIKETFETVCKWHPVSKNMDIFKWGKLARKMKFLDKFKNAQHEVDMAFLRHSLHRQLSQEQFYSLLVDMAIMRFPSPKYSKEEALANLLWGTVVMMPQVNTLVWKKAQENAIVKEIERVCAQTRIVSIIRMRKCKAKYLVQYRSIVMMQSCIRCVVAVKLKKRILQQIEEERIHRLHYKSATLCQKTWRRYKRRAYFLLYRKNRKRMLEEARARRRRKMQKRFRYNLLENIVYRDVTRIHSVPVIVWMLLRQRNEEGEEELEIQVMIIETRNCFKFKLDRHQMRQCLETVILKRGPLSEEEMMKKSTLSTFVSRVSIQKLAHEEPQVSFHRSGIVEKGDLIENSFLHRDGIDFILSMYRTEYDIVIRLHRCERAKTLRVQIPMKLLTEWLLHHEVEQESGCIDYISAWKLAETKRILDKLHCDTINYVAKEKESIPLLLQKEKEEDLREWLKHRISISVDANSREERISLDFENLATKAESIAQRLQSIWRRKKARALASYEVHLQYEKIFDRSSKRYFYVNKRTGEKQWTKPKVLSYNDDINDPPDEWRQESYLDPITHESHSFYFNPATGQTSWLSEEEAARLVQQKFRSKQISELLCLKQVDIRQIVKIVKFCHDVEKGYKEDPSKLMNQLNYALLCQCIKGDIKTAKSLYQTVITKSPTHPVITRAYGIFLLATATSNDSSTVDAATFEKACNLFESAERADTKGTRFQVAQTHFFHWSVMMNPKSPTALLNYALLHQCITCEYYRAEKIYRRAIAIDSTNNQILCNYNTFIAQRYPGSYYGEKLKHTGQMMSVPETVIRRAQVVSNDQTRSYGEWRLLKDSFCSNSWNTFWLNTFDGTSSFEEPDWSKVWERRVNRSKRVASEKHSIEAEYHDLFVNAIFTYNRITKVYSWKKFY